MRLKRFLRKFRYNPKRSFVFMFLFLSLVSLTVGYAFLTTSMSIDGTSKLIGATWDIHFENLEVTTGSVTATTEASITTPTSVSFAAQLENPGDFYEFTVDVVNEGTINAMIQEITVLPVLTTEQQEYLDYIVTYVDGAALEPRQRLNAGTFEKIIVRFFYKDGIDESLYPIEDQQLTIEFELVYVQASDEAIDVEHIFSLYNVLASASVMDNINSTNVNNFPAGIDFSQEPSDTNGKGIYTRSGTENDTYPVHYFRGDISNNNVLFAGICWKMVRTTDTGGIKLIYNGVSDGGSCNISNTTGIGNSVWNTEMERLNHTGYMIGESYTYGNGDSNYRIAYIAPDFTYENGQYTLVGNDDYTVERVTLTRDSTAYRHYTCLNTTTTCDTLWYITYMNGPQINFLVIKNGQKIEDVLNNMLSNVSDSTIKTFIDSWYAENMNSYTNYLEDTVWCNDRELDLFATLEIYNVNYGFSGFNPVGGVDVYTIFSSYDRIKNQHNPSLSCARLIDSFTVSPSNGNGELTYPVGLPTASELLLAGSGSQPNYLEFDKSFWTSSYMYYRIHGNEFTVFCSNFDKCNFTNSYSNTLAVRPAISLKHNTVCSDGDGTATNPYVVVTE